MPTLASFPIPPPLLSPVMVNCVQKATHSSAVVRYSEERNEKAKDVAAKTASEAKLKADINVLSSEKVKF